MSLEKGQSIINIYNLPPIITPTLTPTPTWYYNVDGPYYDDVNNYWICSFNTPSSETTYTVSAAGYYSQDVTINGDTSTDVNMVVAPLYISKLSDGTNTYTIKDADARTSISNLATVATTGNYSDLSNKPIIPTVIPADNSTITENANNQLQTVGIVNQNTQSGAVSPLKVWNGTEQEWNIGGGSQTWYNWQSLPGYIDIESEELNNSFWSSVAASAEIAISVSSSKSVISNIYHGIFGEWFEIQNFPANFTPQAVACGNNKFVILGTSSIVYSTDGNSWTEVNIPAGYYSGIRYLNNQFIIFGANIATSADATSWTAGTMPTDMTIMSDIAYGNNTYVAGGDDGSSNHLCAISQNLTTWTVNTFVDNFYKIAFGNNTFVVINSSQPEATYYSTDNGATWNTSNLTRVSMDVTFGNGLFFIKPSSAESNFYTSSDGVDWTATNIGGSSYMSGGVAYSEAGVFIAMPLMSQNCFNYVLPLTCYLTDSTPTYESTVYSAPNVTSTLTITNISIGDMELSDKNTYYYNSDGNQTTTSSVGQAHPDWICNIEGVGIKIGTTVIATAGGGSSYIAGTGIDITNNVISTDTTKVTFRDWSEN